MKFLTILFVFVAFTYSHAQQNNYLVNSGNGNGLRFWDASDNYKIHMGIGMPEYQFGPVSGYAIKMNMSNDAGRGWVWGSPGIAPVAALGTNGQMRISSHFESNGNIVSYRASTGYLALSGDLPGYSDGVYPTLKTDGTYLHFSVAGKYSGYIGQANAQMGLLDANAAIKVVLNTNGVTYFNGGSVGIGTAAPQGKLEVVGEIHVSRNYPYVQLNSSYWNGQASFIQNGVTNAAAAGGDYFVFYNPPSKAFNFRQGTYDAMTINASGNVGVGTLSPDQKLTVKGKIHAEEVIIDLSVPAPDYVFEKSYDLKSLDEVEKYIEENKHLPEVPSAEEMEKDGVKVGEMEMILLKKIEELTLHVIELKKEIDQIKKGK
jgi:hypothetical protein